MGKRGRPPTPKAILRQRGSWRGNLNPDEPNPNVEAPEKPAHLTSDQAAVWDQVTKPLLAMKCLSVADFSALERYCVYFCRWRECERHVATYGLTYAVRSKDEPEAFIAYDAEDESYITDFKVCAEAKESHTLDHTLRQIETMFGLTPSARSRITVPSEVLDSTSDDVARILKISS